MKMRSRIPTLTKRLIRDSRKSQIWLAVIALTMGGIFVSIFPSLADMEFDFGGYIDAFPPAFKEIFNLMGADFQVFEVFISVEYLSMFFAIVFFPFVIVWSLKLAKDYEKGTLALNVTYPIRRRDIITSQLIDIIIKCIYASITLVLSILIFTPFLNIEPDLVGWAHYLIIVTVFFLAVGTMGVAVSSVTLNSTRVISVLAGFLAFGYILDVIAKLIESLEFVRYISPFYYYGDSIVVLRDHQFTNYAFLYFGVIIVISIVVAYISFRRKDLSIG